ncbi:hypothetical protein BD770DRAFT_141571 [Pilaira anomala]|nr:hypothetical protein BD770DRAFT_141571 [Pilaira anomala]
MVKGNVRADIQKAVQIFERFTDPNNDSDINMMIPPCILQEARGIVFIRLYHVGFGFSAKGGTGIVIGRLPDGSWSAPSGVSIASIGFGHQAGGEIIESIMVMNRKAIKVFYEGGRQFELGMSIGLVVGPNGRAAEVSTTNFSSKSIAVTYAYSAAKGLYAGFSFNGSKISERRNANADYYGNYFSANDILTGVVRPPHEAARLYNLLNSMGAGPRPGLPFASKKDKIAQNSPMSTVSITPPPPYQDVGSGDNPENNNNTTSFRQNYMYNGTNSNTTTPVQHIQYNSLNQSFVSYNNIYLNNNTNTNTEQPLPTDKNIITVVVANYDYQSSGPNDLSFSAGDHIVVTKWTENRGSWWEGEIGGRRGCFPANYTRQIKPWFQLSVGSNSSLQKQPFHNNKNQYLLMDTVTTVVIALFDYCAFRPTDLSFSTGDHIIVTNSRDGEDMWEGVLGDKRGLFPVCYTKDASQ